MEQLPLWAVIVGAVVLVVEYFLGKTMLIPQGSILEVILSTLAKIAKAILPGKKE